MVPRSEEDVTLCALGKVFVQLNVRIVCIVENKQPAFRAACKPLQYILVCATNVVRHCDATEGSLDALTRRSIDEDYVCKSGIDNYNWSITSVRVSKEHPHVCHLLNRLKC